ncbi:MAG: hypothetical protein ACREP9_14275 [Candidatus Dormibacteraceae bacterium]
MNMDINASRRTPRPLLKPKGFIGWLSGKRAKEIETWSDKIDEALTNYAIGKADQYLNSFEAHVRHLTEPLGELMTMRGLFSDKRGER